MLRFYIFKKNFNRKDILMKNVLFICIFLITSFAFLSCAKPMPDELKRRTEIKKEIATLKFGDLVRSQSFWGKVQSNHGNKIRIKFLSIESVTYDYDTACRFIFKVARYQDDKVAYAKAAHEYLTGK